MSSVLLGYAFKSPALMTAALRHSSMTSRKMGSGGEHFERLEFLGDRVVGLIVATMLMEAFPTEKEGMLTRHHTALVRAESLARIAREADLAASLKTATNDAAFGGAVNDNMLADALEAAFGAIYLDGGLSAAEPIIRRLFQPHLSDKPTDLRDPKTRLQEWAQGRGVGLPQYEVVSQTGAAHAPQFVVRVRVASGQSAEGTGTSKRLAEQQAATHLLESLHE